MGPSKEHSSLKKRDLLKCILLSIISGPVASAHTLSMVLPFSNLTTEPDSKSLPNQEMYNEILAEIEMNKTTVNDLFIRDHDEFLIAQTCGECPVKPKDDCWGPPDCKPK